MTRQQRRHSRRWGRASDYTRTAWLTANWSGRNAEPGYRKSIWPDGKIAKPGRMA